MLRVSLSRRHTLHLHLHNDDGTRRRKTDHPRPETKVVSAARGSVGGVCFGDTDYTRGRKYVSRIIAARVSLSLSLCVHSLGWYLDRPDFALRTFPSIECKGSVSLWRIRPLFSPCIFVRNRYIPPSTPGFANARTNFSMGTEIPCFESNFFPLQSVFRSIWEYSNNLHLKMASKFNAPMLTNFKEKIRVWLGVRRKSSKFWLFCWKAVVNKGCLTRL